MKFLSSFSQPSSPSYTWSQSQSLSFLAEAETKYKTKMKTEVIKPENITIFSGLVIIARGFHPFPFRTRSLSPSAPMILLHGGKVGRCRDFLP